MTQEFFTEGEHVEMDEVDASFRRVLEAKARDQSLTDAEFDDWLRGIIEYVFGASGARDDAAQSIAPPEDPSDRRMTRRV